MDNKQLTIEEIADKMLLVLKEAQGKRQIKPVDLIKSMANLADKKDCKEAIRLLIDEGRCNYVYLGNTYIVLSGVDKGPPGS